MYYKHVDVFSNTPFNGNSLSVFILPKMLDSHLLQKIAEEMRHFESIFLCPINNQHLEFQAKIFTINEELDFAGHPLIGAASVIHDEYYQSKIKANIKFHLKNRIIDIQTLNNNTHYTATMNQGKPLFISQIKPDLISGLMALFNLSTKNLANLPLEIISTGLHYLIIPLISGLENINHSNIKPILNDLNAQFVYFYDILKNEARTWDNLGQIEDVATGSAIGPLGAYLVKHQLAKPNEEIVINQGSYVNRPSKLKVKIYQSNTGINKIEVSGDTYIIGSGNIVDSCFNT